MSDKKFQTIIDCGFSKIRAGAFNEEGANKPFFIESNFYTDQYNFKLDIQKIVASLEKSTNEYIDNIDLNKLGFNILLENIKNRCKCKNDNEKELFFCNLCNFILKQNTNNNKILGRGWSILTFD